MDSPISLQYPKGRVHETMLTTADELKPGYEFDLHGRHWKAVELLRLPRGTAYEARRMLCHSTAGTQAARTTVTQRAPVAKNVGDG